MAVMTSKITMIYTRMNRTPASGHDRLSWPFVAAQTLIGGSAYQNRNASDLRELLVKSSVLTGACRLPSAFRRPRCRRRG